MNEVMRENLKSINLKNAKYAHITRDVIKVYCESINKDRVKTLWVEQCPNDIPIRLCGDNIIPSYRSIYIDTSLIGFLKDFTVIEYWPKNSFKDSGYLMKTLVFKTKKGQIYANFRTINGIEYKDYFANLICSSMASENNLFKKKAV